MRQIALLFIAGAGVMLSSCNGSPSPDKASGSEDVARFQVSNFDS